MVKRCVRGEYWLILGWMKYRFAGGKRGEYNFRTCTYIDQYVFIDISKLRPYFIRDTQWWASYF
jgi:hypothetical protein